MTITTETKRLLSSRPVDLGGYGEIDTLIDKYSRNSRWLTKTSKESRWLTALFPRWVAPGIRQYQDRQGRVKHGVHIWPFAPAVILNDQESRVIYPLHHERSTLQCHWCRCRVNRYLRINKNRTETFCYNSELGRPLWKSYKQLPSWDSGMPRHLPHSFSRSLQSLGHYSILSLSIFNKWISVRFHGTISRLASQENEISTGLTNSPTMAIKGRVKMPSRSQAEGCRSYGPSMALFLWNCITGAPTTSSIRFRALSMEWGPQTRSWCCRTLRMETQMHAFPSYCRLCTVLYIHSTKF